MLIPQNLSPAIGALLCLGLGFMAGYGIETGESSWYAGLIKPSYNPPGWIFAPVWSILYIFMGIVLAWLWGEPAQNKVLLIIFALQMLFNLAWTPLFFHMQRVDLALYDIILLWVSLLSLLVLAAKKRAILLLLLPYMLWVSFALVLNYVIFSANG